MAGLQEYAELADDAMKKAVRKTATSVKKEIAANAPTDTGAYGKSWTTKKVKENSHTLQMTVHSKNGYQLAYLLEKAMPSGMVVVCMVSRILHLLKNMVRNCWNP